MSQEVAEKIDKTIAAHEQVLKDINRLTISKDELLKRNEELKQLRRSLSGQSVISSNVNVQKPSMPTTMWQGITKRTK